MAYVRSFASWFKESGMSAQDLAVVLGVSRALIYKWKGGGCYPSVPVLAKIEALSKGTVTARSFGRVGSQGEAADDSQD